MSDISNLVGRQQCPSLSLDVRSSEVVKAKKLGHLAPGLSPSSVVEQGEGGVDAEGGEDHILPSLGSGLQLSYHLLEDTPGEACDGLSQTRRGTRVRSFKNVSLKLIRRSLRPSCDDDCLEEDRKLHLVWSAMGQGQQTRQTGAWPLPATKLVLTRSAGHLGNPWQRWLSRKQRAHLKTAF